MVSFPPFQHLSDLVRFDGQQAGLLETLRCAEVLPNSSRQHNPEPKLHSSFWYEHVCSNIQIQTLFQFQSPASKADFQTGDLVVLGAEGYEGSTAVVCEMSAMDCKVAILDPSRSFKKAEAPCEVFGYALNP